jgi:hypothetical protein
MLTFIGEHILEIIFGLCSAGALAMCKYFHGQMKSYKKLLDEKEQKELLELIDEKIKPIVSELESLKLYIEKVETVEREHTQQIVESYKFRLTQLCKIYLSHGSFTASQFEQLNAFYQIYSGLGGDDEETKNWYNKAKSLQVLVEA